MSALARLWTALYPLGPDAPAEAADLASHAPALAGLLASHRPAALRGLSMRDALGVGNRAPGTLRRIWEAWSGDEAAILAASPTLALAVMGQARADGRLAPEQDGAMHGRLLQAWALAGAVSVASRPPPAALALAL